MGGVGGRDCSPTYKEGEGLPFREKLERAPPQLGADEHELGVEGRQVVRDVDGDGAHASGIGAADPSLEGSARLSAA
jgi:hypothetical protein